MTQAVCKNSGAYVNFKNSKSCGALNHINLGVKNSTDIDPRNLPLKISRYKFLNSISSCLRQSCSERSAPTAYFSISASVLFRNSNSLPSHTAGFRLL